MHKLVPRLAEWLKDKVAAAGAQGLVFGLSGGIDSAVVAALAKRAVPDNSLGVIMPCFSRPQDAEDARLVAEHLNLPTKTVVLDRVFADLLVELCGEDYSPSNERDLTVANIKPRLRMTTLYFYAARNSYLVAGTGNRSEIVIGFFTKYGDGGADLLPLANLLKTEVWDMARHLDLPERIIARAPSAGLWHDHVDEDEFGFSYQELDNYLAAGEGSAEVKAAVNKWIRRNRHKREMPAVPPF